MKITFGKFRERKKNGKTTYCITNSIDGNFPDVTTFFDARTLFALFFF